MRRTLTIVALLTSAAFLVYWLWRHHLFMWGGPALPTWIFGVLRYLVLPWFVTAWILCVAWLIWPWGPAVVRVGIGLGLIGAYVWVLAVVGWLFEPLIAIPLALLGVSALVKLWQERPGWGWTRQVREWPWLDKLILGVIAWWVLRTVLLACNPSHGFDAISAHLWQVQEYMETHGHVSSPYMTNIALAHCLTVVQKSFVAIDFGSTIQYTAAAMSALLLYLIGQRWFGRTAGLLAALTWLVSPYFYFVY